MNKNQKKVNRSKNEKRPEISRRMFFKRTGGAGLVAVAGVTAFSQKDAYAMADCVSP